MRAAVLINQPVQHFAPAFRLLSGAPGLHTRVYYWDSAVDGVYDPGFHRHVRWKVDLHSGYDWWSPEPGARWGRGAQLLRRLFRDRPEIILCFGWATPVARLGIAYATATGTPLLYYGDSNPRSPISGRHRLVRGFILRRLFRIAAGAVSTGSFNREFYLSHGVAPQRVHPGVYPTEVALFTAAARQRRRSRMDSNGKPIVIGFAGKFVHIKGVDDLVAAAARLPRDERWELRLIGDGPLRPSIESLVSTHQLRDRVRFLGFRNTDEIPELLSEVDVMVMPSRVEPRGLVAIEAMAAGAAVVVSSATGVWGPGDVLQHEETGLVFPAGDVDALTQCLRRLMTDKALRDRLGRAGRARVTGSGPDGFATTVATALLATVREGR